jgi:hypothetical protein
MLGSCTHTVFESFAKGSTLVDIDNDNFLQDMALLVVLSLLIRLRSATCILSNESISINTICQGLPTKKHADTDNVDVHGSRSFPHRPRTTTYRGCAQTAVLE